MPQFIAMVNGKGFTLKGGNERLGVNGTLGFVANRHVKAESVEDAIESAILAVRNELEEIVEKWSFSTAKVGVEQVAILNPEMKEMQHGKGFGWFPDGK